MAGIYIHIPFCKSRCIYCGFYSTTHEELRDRYVEAVCREYALRKGYIKERVRTIYIGGGTPSQLNGKQLEKLFSFLPEAEEVTMECNPDDVTEEFADLIRELPVNRVSMGAQTFNDERLRFLHRRHTSCQVHMAVDCLRRAGIENISIDLMYGFPEETLSEWEHDIRSAVALNVEHLSAYALMYEEGTPLHHLLCQGKIRENNEETELMMYSTLIDRLTEAGYEHYEISNFARPSYRSRHNSSYWNETPYLGLGAAAHSYDRKSREWNVEDVRAYIQGIEDNHRCFEQELLDEDTRYNDRVMTALRTCEGLSLNRLSEPQRDYCMQQAKRFLDDGQLQIVNGQLKLTRKGLFISNMVMSELMKVE